MRKEIGEVRAIVAELEVVSADTSAGLAKVEMNRYHKWKKGIKAAWNWAKR